MTEHLTAPPPDVTDDGQPSTLQARLEGGDRPGRDGTGPGPTEGKPSIDDPVGLVGHLEASGRFHRDAGLGRIFHPGKVSLRENLPTESLHLVIDGNRLAAHVDRVSPLGLPPDAPARYSARRAVAHNLVGMAQDLVRLLRGRQGDHRSELDCEWVWDLDEIEPEAGALLAPEGSAWSLHLEAHVGGSLEGPRLRRALARALGGRPADHDPLAVIDCAGDDDLDAARAQLQSLPVAVSEWPPLRVGLAHHPEGDVVMLNINHAAADGVGALEVLRSIAQAYDTDADIITPPDLLAACDLPVRPASGPVSSWVARWYALVERVRDLLARPARLAPDKAEDQPGHGVHLLRLSTDETRRLAEIAGDDGTANVLLAGLHLAIGTWDLDHGAPGRRVGVLVHVDLRPPDWRPETVGNFSVTARVSTSRRHRADGPSALTAVAAQTSRNRRSRSGVALVAALERSGLLALWAKQSLMVLRPLTTNRLVDTAMLADLGALDEVPSFGADAGPTVGLWYSAPARMPLALCLGAVTVGGQVHLAVRYPHRLFSADAARRFAECYRAQLREMTEDRS